MSNQIGQLPTDKNFGLDFNYAVWTPGTSVLLCNVPWNSDYRDIVFFPSDDDLNTYLDNTSGPRTTVNNLSYAKPGNPVRLNIPFNRAYQYNYLKAYNPAQPIPGNDTPRAFYYFITDVRYVAPNTTELQVQLDVWQTFCRHVTFGNCFIERGHIGIANVNQFDDHGRTYLTVPEGLDIGNEYVVARQYENVMVDMATGSAADQMGVIVASTTAITADPGNVGNPQLKTAEGSLFERMPNGCELWYFDNPAEFSYWQLYISNFPWVAQGVISVTAVPKLPVDLGTGVSYDVNNPERKIIPLFGVTSTTATSFINLAPNFRNDVNLGRYSRLKKFLTYPYTLVELTTFSGNPILLKPECVNTDTLTVGRMMHVGPPNPRIVFYPKGYNAAAGDADNQSGEFLNMATGIFDLPTFSLVNNGYLGYMASNRNAIAFQHTSADWSQQRALKGADTAFNQARVSANTGLDLAQQSIDAQMAQMRLSNDILNYRGIQKAGNAVVDGLAIALNPMAGGPAAGILRGVQGGANAFADVAIGAEQNTRGAAIDTNLTRGQSRSKYMNETYAMDTNYQYASFAAQGDYANAIAGINAKVQDAKMIQPTTSGQIGGDAFNLATFKWGIFARLKTLQPAAMAVVGEFWLRYGYAVNRFGKMPATYQVMDKFTYWKLRETYIRSSSCPEGFKQTIRGIFEKGVTVWSNPTDIGMIDTADNAPLSGVTL